MYSLRAYGKMLAEPIRRQAYLDAIAAAVRPGCVVLEIGTGPGIFALYAARLGARKVYAVEPNEAIHVARQLAAVNGLSERIEFCRGLSTELDLPERVDVIVSDLRGVLPPFRNHLPSVIDARERLLAPGGILIPQQDSLWASVVTAEDAYRDLSQGWCDCELGLDLSLPLDIVKNTFAKERIEPDQCLVEPRRWAVLDYRTITGHDLAGHLRWEVSGNGLAHGLAVWFDTILTAESGFSNAPGQPELIYGRTFFPFPRPVELHPRDRLEVALEAVRVGTDYVWRWTTSIERTSAPLEQFEQSTFHGTPLSPSGLRKQAASYLPQLNDNGKIASFVLARMNGRTSLETIARELHAAFSGRFENWRDALTRVAEQAELFS